METPPVTTSSQQCSLFSRLSALVLGLVFLSSVTQAQVHNPQQSGPAAAGELHALALASNNPTLLLSALTDKADDCGADPDHPAALPQQLQHIPLMPAVSPTPAFFQRHALQPASWRQPPLRAPPLG